MDLLDNTSNIHWVNNIRPYLKHRLFGFPQDGDEKINFEGYSNEGFPVITSFYDKDFDKPKFVALIKLTLNSLAEIDLNEYVTKTDVQDIETIKSKYSSLPIPKQVVFYQLDADYQIIDQRHKNI